MPKFVPLSLLSLLACAGCQQTSLPDISLVPNAPAASPGEELTPVAGIPVTLQLPNMVCGGCAAEVEKGLKNLDGIANIQTDFNTHRCRFTVTDSSLDWKAKLAELAKDNSHLEDWSVVEASSSEESTEKDS